MISIILDRTQIFCPRRRCCLSSKAVCYTSVIRTVVQGCTEMPWRIVSHRYVLILSGAVKDKRRGEIQMMFLDLEGRKHDILERAYLENHSDKVPVLFLLFISVWLCPFYLVLWASVPSSVKWTQYLTFRISLRMNWNKNTAYCGTFVRWLSGTIEMLMRISIH